ncbi:MAG TPA: hemerythrin domain-containing protein [Allosphingosinicella sp.]|nr:hemerythrin domain-containing protein [Allosphingosinicella sp.]
MDGMSLLRFEHTRIASMARELTAMASQSMPANQLALFRVRAELRKALTVHLKREDWVLYPRLLASERPEVCALAKRLGAEAVAFSSAFRDYCRQWTTVCIAADWLGFRKETLAILSQLQHRIHVEDHELYPLVGDEDDVHRLRTPADVRQGSFADIRR